MKKLVITATSIVALLLAEGCAAPTIPADNPYASRVVSPDYDQANVRTGYYVNVGSGVTAPARVFVYQGDG